MFLYDNQTCTVPGLCYTITCVFKEIMQICEFYFPFPFANLL